MKKLSIDRGHISMITDTAVTLADLTHLAEQAVEAKIPTNAEVTNISVNYSGSYGSTFKWELNISWRMPAMDINVEKDLP